MNPLASRLLGLVSLTLLSSGCAGPIKNLRAPSDDGYRTEFASGSGVLLGGRFQQGWLGGDFDGDTVLDGVDLIELPDTDDGVGFGVDVGLIEDGRSFTIGYANELFDGSLGAFDADVRLNQINFDLVRYQRGNEKLQPYFLFGLAFAWADLDDASTDGIVRGDAELNRGFGLRGGGGLSYWFTKNVALDVRATGTVLGFTEAEGVLGVEATIDDPVWAYHYGISVGLTLVL